MTTPESTHQPRPGTKDYFRLEAERLQAELDRLRGAKHEEMVGLNVRVPRRLRDKARDLGHARDLAMREVVTEALEMYLAGQEPDTLTGP